MARAKRQGQFASTYAHCKLIIQHWMRQDPQMSTVFLFAYQDDENGISAKIHEQCLRRDAVVHASALRRR
ncbi:MAG: hypothetical protein J5863_09880, partial [Desulfovibrio sp.]|nr:hypothetical protein [Desulfovibrio sp.]